MKTADFDYQLPDELIARYPMADRTASRLLVVAPNGDLEHRQFADIGDYLKAGDLLVLNNTRVIPARLFGKKASGGQLEMLVERIEDERQALVHIRCSRSPKEGAELLLTLDESRQTISDFCAEVLGRSGDLFRVCFSAPVLEVLDAIGHMPLPPYIDRSDEALDRERYQTVFADQPGAVAAPTAGLHFDDKLLAQLAENGIERVEVTLHVGAGTFQPVKVDNVAEHKMHSEWIEVSQSVCDKVAECRAGGGRVVAIGTTAVRALETAGRSGTLKPFTGDTDIFLYPGKSFHCVDMLVTNFHLPQSTLLMLVSAFAGTERIRHAYQQAVQEKYRFFSYGDAMLLHYNPESGLNHE